MLRMNYKIAALYHFTRFENPQNLRTPLQELCDLINVKGSLLLAHEGINGTIAGSHDSIDRVLSHLRTLPGCENLEHKESFSDSPPFLRMKVKLKREIVTMGKPDVDPRADVGTYVAAKDWNDLIAQDDVIVIDTRNDYEVGIGSFEGAIDPNTASFRDFPGWWEANKDRYHNKRVAMYCTGGIRCEKASNYLQGAGVDEVFHLKGGILKYLEDVPEAESQWNGKCFVFDARVSVGHGLEEGEHLLCYACRRPIEPEDKQRPEYEKGVSCHQCISEHDDERKHRFRERQKQVELAAKRGERHIG